jgi:predicted MFS family arabinose efflux permease
VAAALGHLTIVQLYIAATVEGTLYVFFNLAEVACLPRVVPTEQLPEASGRNQAAETAAFIVASPMGGFLFQSLGRTVPWIFDSISYVVSVISLTFIKTEFQAERTAAQRKLRVEIMEGLRWLWQQRLIRYMAFCTGMLNLVGTGTLLPLYVLARHQGASPAIIGSMFAVGSIGGVAGSLFGPWIQRRYTFGQVIIATVWLQALFTPLYAIAPNTLLLGVISAFIFVNGPVYNVVQFSYRLALIPDELQGRVNSAFRLVAFGFNPLGGALSGVLIQRYGAVTTVLVFSVILLSVAVLTMVNPQVRHARPLAEARAL